MWKTLSQSVTLAPVSLFVVCLMLVGWHGSSRSSDAGGPRPEVIQSVEEKVKAAPVVVDWSQVELPAGATLKTSDDGAVAIRVEGTPGEAVTIDLTAVVGPSVTSNRYALFGRMRYLDVGVEPTGETFESLHEEASRVVPEYPYPLPMMNPVFSRFTNPNDPASQSYVEMWSVFSDDERYFSRTLDMAGPAKILYGSSDWRALGLPFQIVDDRDERPTKLELRLVLPAGGTVEIGNLKLVEVDSEDELRALIWNCVFCC